MAYSCHLGLLPLNGPSGTLPRDMSHSVDLSAPALGWKGFRPRLGGAKSAQPLRKNRGHLCDRLQ
jgi:hypothetical protein